MNLLLGLAILALGVVVAAIVLGFPFIVLLWLYDIRAATRRQADAMEAMARTQGWTPKR